MFSFNIHKKYNKFTIVENKHELHTSAYLNVGEFDFQTAFSLTSHIGITANAYTILPKSYRIMNGTFVQNKYDFSLGYYTYISENEYFSTFVGGGMGFLNGDMERHWVGQYNIEMLKYSTDYKECYLQINYYHKFNKWDIGFSLRNNLIYYEKYNYSNIKDEYIGYPVPIVLTDTIQQENIYGYAIDPVVNIQFKLNRFRLLGQFGYSISNLNIEDRKLINNVHGNYLTNFNNQPRYQRLIFKIGVQYVFGLGLNKK